MPLIFRYFWFGGAVFMLAYIVFLRTRLAVVIERGAATADEVNRFLAWLVAWFVVGPLILGVVGLVAGWASPFCGAILQFDTRARTVAALINIAIWASVLWWIWRGRGADFLTRVASTSTKRAFGTWEYSPRLIRALVTAVVVFSAVGAVISSRVMPPSPDFACPADTVAG